MHESTQTYLDIAASDDAVHSDAVAALRAASTVIHAMTRRATEKAEALVAVQCDEPDPKVTCLLYEGHDKQKTVQRLAAEWQDRTLKLLQHIRDVEAYDARLIAATQTEPSGVAK